MSSIPNFFLSKDKFLHGSSTKCSSYQYLNPVLNHVRSILTKRSRGFWFNSGLSNSDTRHSLYCSTQQADVSSSEKPIKMLLNLMVAGSIPDSTLVFLFFFQTRGKNKSGPSEEGDENQWSSKKPYLRSRCRSAKFH